MPVNEFEIEARYMLISLPSIPGFSGMATCVSRRFLRNRSTPGMATNKVRIPMSICTVILK